MTYEYVCLNCGNFDLEQSIKDDAIKVCPMCKAPVYRKISGNGFILKGSGFYSTENRK
jgi:putative FmdB family regulatory protein